MTNATKPARVHGTQDLPQDGQNAPRRISCTCLECGEPFAALVETAEFCSTHCRTGFNNRRKSRGAEIYDLLMALRFDRSIANVLKVWSVLSRLAAKFRDEDRRERAGRKSWRPPRTVLERHVDVVAQIVRRGSTK